METINFSSMSEHLRAAVASGTVCACDRIAVKDGKDIFFTRKGAKLSALKKDDIEMIELHGGYQVSSFEGISLQLFSRHARIGALVMSSAPGCVSVSRTGETVRPYVDDIAQIIGVNIHSCDISDIRGITSQLKKRNAVLLKGAGVLCADGSLDDALASAMIAEKACTIHIQGSYIGGGKAINLLESAL
ncbi:MAG: class II aldolase/adducin family protein, partial [Spirochaetota bacterium]